jgi:EAL domain-containing protein (putative c-di-GMP-specific phosphodiesterase class I)/FixJ family two-component response regulator
MTLKSVFVLDDDPRVRATVVHVLNSIGYEAQEFCSPEPMLASLEKRPPEIVILDLSLGQSDAVEVIRHLAALKYEGKVLLISGHAETVLKDIQLIGERYGLAMLASLHKPFRGRDIINRLNTPTAIANVPPVKEARNKVAVDLMEALNAGWLTLWYQPKIDLRTLSICGAEALLRMMHPEHGIVPPLEFLPTPGSPLHHPLAKFVMARAMADWQCFADAGIPLKLSINMPVSVISAPDFMGIMRRCLPTDRRFPGLIIEVTEDEMVKDATWIHEVSAQLKLLNVSVSIDDFGIAHSSMSRLLELPCSELKLDRSFVSNCASDQLKHAVCQTIVDLAHRVGNVVCAEGVEHAEDLKSIIYMGCDTVQGFIFAKPMGPDALIQQEVALRTKFLEHFGSLATDLAPTRSSNRG